MNINELTLMKSKNTATNLIKLIVINIVGILPTRLEIEILKREAALIYQHLLDIG